MNFLSKITDFIRLGFITLNSKPSHLGDRSTYVGASEMVLLKCPQQAIKSKRFPMAYDYKTSVRFERGHAMEDKLELALQTATEELLKGMDVDFIREVEYTHPSLSLKSHIDFQITVADLAKIVGKENITPAIEACHVVFIEVKSSFEAVCHDQIISQLGIAHSAGIKAANIAIVIDSTSGDIEADGPFFHDPIRYADLEARGVYLLECLAGRSQAKAIPGIGCSFCQYREECTAFPCLELPEEIAAKVFHYDAIAQEMRALDAQKELLRDNVKDFIKNDSRFQTGGLLVSLKSYPATTSYDGPALAEAIKSAKADLESLRSKLTDAVGYDLFTFSAAAETFNGLAKTIGNLESSLETCLKSKAAYQKFEVKGEKAKAPSKRSKKSKMPEAEAAS